MAELAWPAGAPGLCCLACGEVLAPGGPGLTCAGCGRGYDVVEGIPDLRPELAGFDVEADRALAAELGAAAVTESFEELLVRYWRTRPEVDAARRARFVRGDLIGEDRAAEVAAQIEELVGPLPPGPVLELGAGTAALGTVLARRAPAVVVSDVSLSWLVLARHRVAAAGLANVAVVACTAARLPFGPGSFDLVVGADVIEHVPDGAGLVEAAWQVLRPGASLWLSTPNRLSLTPEPHVRLLGVGWLPRRWARAYVRRFRGIDYADVTTLSLAGLRRLLSRPGGSVEVVAPGIAGAVRSTYGPSGRALISAYDAARRLPVLGRAVRVVSPLFHARLTKPLAGGG